MYNFYGLGEAPSQIQVTVGDAQILTQQDQRMEAQRNVVVDFFRAIYLQADQEQRVALINNYLQLQWRAAVAAKLDRGDPVMVKLDGIMGQWWTWKTQYDDAALRRWIPGTRSWGSELDNWSQRVEAIQGELDAATNDAVSTTLEKQGLNPTMIKPTEGEQAVTETLKRLNELLRSPWLWPTVGVLGTLFVLGGFVRLYRDLRPAH